MNKIAIFNIECLSSSEAIISLIERYHEKIAIVVTTNMYDDKKGNALTQLVKNSRRSGIKFAYYLSFNFLFYFWGIYLSRLASLVGRKRKNYTIAELCKKYGIRHIKTSNINSKEIETELQQANLDLIVIYFFDQIIQENIIKIPKQGVLNVHAALLPECKGLFPVFYSALNNNSQFGITVHEIVDTSIDSGPILGQQKIIPPANQSILSLSKIINSGGVDLGGGVIVNLDYYRQHRKRENKGGSYFSYPTKENIRNIKEQNYSLVSFSEFINQF